MQRKLFSPIFVAAFGCLMIAVSTGCQCTRLTDCYSNVIDDISDHQGHLDNCYCACFDLTRIGYSDWRACRCNRIWCRKCAKKDNCHCEAYHSGAYGPVYSSPAMISPENSPAPPVPAPEPVESLPADE